MYKEPNKSKGLHEAVKNILIDETGGLTRSEARQWIDDLTDYGCVSGIVGSLVYYADTVEFFDDFENEILELAREHEIHPDATGLGVDGYKNQMTWFAFETLAQPIFEELEFPEDE